MTFFHFLFRSASLQDWSSLAGLLCSTGLLFFLQHYRHTVLPVGLNSRAAGYFLVPALAQKCVGVFSFNAISHLVCTDWRGVPRRGLEKGAGNTAERVHTERKRCTEGEQADELKYPCIPCSWLTFSL